MAFWFSWDPAKARANIAKHGVSFTIAARVFLDPHALAEPDRIEGGEQRWQSIGLVDGVLLLLVAHTMVDDDDGTVLVRIISARRATTQERRRYGQARRGPIPA